MLDPADFMQAMLVDGQNKHGQANCYVAADHYLRQFGMPIPSLALQYMIGVENLPFGRFYGFSGPPQSMKSSMCYWMLRNIMEQGGLGLLVETERKVSDTLMEGIIGRFLKQLLLFNATTLEQAQDMINNAFAFYKKNVPERHIPYGLCWDSLRGVLSEQTSKKINAEGGHYTKQYSNEAHAISPFFAKMVEDLSFWPMILFFVQHEKKKQETNGGSNAPQRTQLGGDAPKFHSTVLFRCNITQGVKEGAANPYANVQFKTLKNNLGLLGKRVGVTIHFNQRTTDEGRQVHNYWFDWAKADCDMLTGEKLANKPGVKSVLNLEEHSSNKGYYRCPELGTKKSTANEIRIMMRAPENAQLMTNLRHELRIQHNLRFDEVEWVHVGGTPKKKLYDWQVKEGVDLTPIVAISEEEYSSQEPPKEADTDAES